MPVRDLVTLGRRRVWGRTACGGEILRALRVRASANSRRSWVLNSLLMTRCQKPVCASQDRILRSLPEGLRELPQAVQDNYTCGSLQPELRRARGGSDQGHTPRILRTLRYVGSELVLPPSAIALSLAVLWESGKMLFIVRSAGTDPGQLTAEIVTQPNYHS